MEFIFAAKNSQHGLLLVITDKDVFGKKFEEGNKQLDLTNDFYKGEEKTLEQIEVMLPTARHIHATGKQIIDFLIEKKLVEQENILVIAGVPHAQVVIEG